MRRQMKLQSQAEEQCGRRDSDDRQVDSSSRSTAPELHSSSSPGWDRKHQRGSPTWSKPSSSAIHSPLATCISGQEIRRAQRSPVQRTSAAVALPNWGRRPGTMRQRSTALWPRPAERGGRRHRYLPQTWTETETDAAIIHYLRITQDTLEIPFNLLFIIMHNYTSNEVKQCDWEQRNTHFFTLRLSQCHVLSVKPMDPFQISGILRSRRHRSWVNFYRGWTETTANVLCVCVCVCSHLP